MRDLKGKKVSTNFIAIKPVKNLYELLEHKSVYVTNWNKMYPTAWLLSMQLRMMLKWQKDNCFWICVHKDIIKSIKEQYERQDKIKRYHGFILDIAKNNNLSLELVLEILN